MGFRSTTLTEAAGVHWDRLDIQNPEPSANSTLDEKKEAKPRKNFFKPIKGKLSHRQKYLIDDALLIEQEDSEKAKATGYMARTLVQATLPHSDPKLPLGQLYSRTTGKLTLTVAPTSPKYGVPYGSIPRVILAWISTEVVRTRERTLSLGHKQVDFLKRVQMQNNGNDISRFKEQSQRLFKSVISIEYADDKDGDRSQRLQISDKSSIFWHPRKPDQVARWDSTLDLSMRLYDEILSAPVPIDLRVLHALTKSPMAMDIYCWLTYRVFVLSRSGKPFVLIPWLGLKMQFGAGYEDSQQGLYSFKTNFKKQLRGVLNFYPQARDAIEDVPKSGCLKLTRCALHIEHKKAAPRSSKD